MNKIKLSIQKNGLTSDDKFMNIGILAVDSNYPNLALMKISNESLRYNKSEMSRIQLHKSIQHVTTANGKLSDKTIKLINKIAKKAYGSK